MLKKLFIIILASFIYLSLTRSTWAKDFKRSDLGIDNTISDQISTQYADPNNIWVYNIKTGNESFNYDSEYWYSNLYYYSITRLGYADIPFNYVIDSEGNLFEGRSGGVGVLPEVDSTVGGVMIGYLSNNSEITPEASSRMSELISDLSYTYGITKNSVYAVDLKMKKEEKQTTKSVLQKVNNSFSKSIESVKNSSKYSDTEHISYKAQIEEVKYSTNVKSGERLTVEVSIKNMNDFPWFTDKDPIYISTSNYKDSTFAVNGVWPSFSKPVAISGKTILPQETVKVRFDLQGLLLPGKQNLSFIVMKAPKTAFSGSDFKVSFNIEKGGNKLVQVKETPSGYLNVRSCGGPACEVVGRVNDGQILIMLEKSSGWYKIKYDDKKNGWIYGPYVKEL